MLNLLERRAWAASTLHRMELGEQNVTLQTLEQICDRLKCGVADLFDE